MASVPLGLYKDEELVEKVVSRAAERLAEMIFAGEKKRPQAESFRNLKKADALERALVERNGEAEEEELIRVLVEGGCDMGPEKYHVKNLRIVVARNEHRFYQKGSRVGLVLQERVA